MYSGLVALVYPLWYVFCSSSGLSLRGCSGWGGGGGHIACLGEMCGVGLWLCSRSADWVRCVGEQMDSVPFAGEGGP